jgi:hypothetical protein
MVDLPDINLSPEESASTSSDHAPKARRARRRTSPGDGQHAINEASRPLLADGFSGRSFGEIETAPLRAQIWAAEVRQAVKQMVERDHTLLSRMAGNAHLRRPAGRPATARATSKEVIRTLYPQGVPSDIPDRKLAEEVNERLKRDGLHPVSKKTIDRARRDLGQK